MLNKIEKYSELKGREYFKGKSFNIRNFKKCYFYESIILSVIFKKYPEGGKTR